MKVLCIDDKPNSGTPNPVWRIKFGEIYEVVWELSIHPNFGYWPEHFAPISDIDETELATVQEEVAV